MGKLDKPTTNQWAGFKVEGRASFQFAKTIKFCGRIYVRAKVIFNQKKMAILHSSDSLHRSFADERKGCAQHLMPGHYPVQRPAKSHAVKIALQPQTHRDVVSLAN